MCARPLPGWTATCIAVATSLGCASSKTTLAAPVDMTSLSLEDLMNIQVTSVSKRSQKVSDAPAAVSVIHGEEIRRSGLQSIPELLRLVPGMTVAAYDANKWAVGARGLTALYQHRMLVLMDGRVLYNPQFSGVFWDAHDYLLQDIERIEVIRGPGATLWGANAMNGVVNITTKHAGETQDGLVHAFGSNLDGTAGLRYGGRIGDDTHYRVYTKYRNMGDFELANGSDASDEWKSFRLGGRLDRDSGADLLTVMSELYHERSGERYGIRTLTPPFEDPQDVSADTNAGHILARWTRRSSEHSELSFQAYYDFFRRNDEQFDYDQHTVDLELQHRFALGSRQDITWGAGYRWLPDRIVGALDGVASMPVRSYHYLYSLFVQDEITVVPETLRMVVGTKLEYNDHTGFEVQPTVRGIWTPDLRNSLWAAVSRAVRTPSRFEDETRYIFGRFATAGGGLGESRLVPNRDVEAEELTAYELGYRGDLTDSFSIDVATYYNDYDDLLSFTPGVPFFDAMADPARLVIPVRSLNAMSGHSYGAEIAARWRLRADWHLHAAYAYARVHMKGGQPRDHDYAEDTTPRHQVQLHSHLDLTPEVELNVSAYFVDDLEYGDVPSYTRVDIAPTWRPHPQLELSAGVQNLLDDRHLEFNAPGQAPTDSTLVPRTFYGQLVLRF